MMASKLKNQIPGVQFSVFFALTVAMILLNLMVTKAFFPGVASILTADNVTPGQIASFKFSQSISTIMIFMLPALLYGFLSDERPLQYVGLKPNLRPLFFGITILLLVSVQPFAMMIGELNKSADFGKTLRDLEELSEKALEKFLVMGSPSDLLVNILIVAVLPAIGEELFFRGSLQNILERWTNRPVVAIFLSSLFFALFHFSVFKLLPIFVLGIVLGTIFYITRNLWYSIFFHFVNNTMALLASYYAQRNEFMKKLAEDDVQFAWWAGLVSFIVTVSLFVLLRKRSPAEPLEKTWARSY